MGAGNSPCASCKLLRRRCTKDCAFAPYFPADEPHKFAIVHKVFGASNISKMLQELPVEQRADAVSSLVYEANARVRDPVYGCVGAISYLQNQVSELQMQLAVAQAEILCIQMQQHQQEEPSAMMMMQPQLLQNENELSSPHLQYFTTLGSSSSSTNNVIHESFKRESSVFGYDMVS
ncbi:LOB domain-containing protein 12 [Stylosanthes scabra]|uniref:LOB domain-containing protein 12 n=1 Tax=Stylosanthes scabra TaxID=79078 RepID=A0ABU6U6J3_9FABA|nr:LOB domain-containing protein 12 [Stylosanthes scabra]